VTVGAILDGAALFGCERLDWPWERDLLAATGRALPPVADVAEDAPIFARINGGRWIVVCDCGMSEAVWLALPLFYCHNCWNTAIGGRWRPVAVPADRDEIQRLLVMRPYVNRAWIPGESVEDVRADNLAHGLEG